MKRYIPLFENKIKYVDPNTLNIEVYDENIVNIYMERIKRNKDITPVFVNNKDRSWIVDGSHRAQAYKNLGMKVPIIEVDRLHVLQQLGTQNLSPKQYYDKYLK